MRERIHKFDFHLIQILQKLEVPFARGAIFIIYFWFGLLKLLNVSPASPIVHALFDRTIHFMSFPFFYALFSIFEMAIGILFLIKGLERLVLWLLALHLITTVLPLFLVPGMTWAGFLTPTLEGQYIIKNVLIIATAITIGAKLVPLSAARKSL